MKENPSREKSYDFALKAIETYKALQKEQRALILSIQLSRYSTSTGANAEDAIWAKSKRDFLLKYSTAQIEVRKTNDDRQDEGNDEVNEI